MLKAPGQLKKISVRKYTVASNEIILPPLPYASNALEPHISQTTVETH